MQHIPKAVMEHFLASLEEKEEQAKLTPKQIARQRVAAYRKHQSATITQAMIDGDGLARCEERLALVLTNTVRFHRRSLWARMTNWLR